MGLVGVFEGGYKHAIKLLLFFGGAAPETLHRLFPPPTYEMPSDVLFEVTGVLQFLAGLMAVRVSVALWRGRRESQGEPSGPNPLHQDLNGRLPSENARP